jgi:hypothetical protein
MLLFYVDEVGVGKMNDASLRTHPWFVLGALGIRDTNRKGVASAIRDLKKSVFGTNWQSRSWKETEIKGSYIAEANNRLLSGRPPLRPIGYNGLTSAKLEQLLHGMFSIFRAFTPVLYAIGIDKVQHLQAPRSGPPFDPVAIAYAFLQQRLASLTAHTTNSIEPALIVADEQSHHESLFRKGEIRSVRNQFQQQLPQPPNIASIIAKPVWIDTTEMVDDKEITQLTDFVSYAVYQGMARQQWSHNWLERLGPHFARHWGTGRRIGAVWNAGITIYPRQRYPRVAWAKV